MKYSFTREKPFCIARRQPANKSSLLIGLPICCRISSRAASGASVRPSPRSVSKRSLIQRQRAFDPQARHRDAHAQRPEDGMELREQLFDLRIVARGKPQQGDFVDAR